ncbi:MAG: hypothetical protein EXR73_09235 [Myxococcales bacterium]|nr:hypothetical protein [Myxococcales bacterium]
MNHYNDGGATDGFTGSKQMSVKALGPTEEELAAVNVFMVEALSGEARTAALTTAPQSFSGRARRGVR